MSGLNTVEDVIKSSIEEAAAESEEDDFQEEPEVEVSSEEPLSEDVTESVSDEEPPPVASAEAEVSKEEQSPQDVAAEKEPDKDEFAEKFGIHPKTSSGRENRIPYSRVKKINEKAVNDAVEALKSEYDPRIQEFETKVTEYEDRLSKVDEFEKVMVEEPQKFLQMLSNIPAYGQFFRRVDEALKSGKPLAAEGTAETKTPETPAADDMPAPNQKMEDGSLVYDMDGLKSVLDWQAKKIEERLTNQITERYKPIEEERAMRERVQAIMPKIRAQIEEARSWPHFSDNETDIIAALKGDNNLSLEGAYRKVVFPRLVTDRDKVRQEVIDELKKAPKATATATTRSRPPAPKPIPKDDLNAVIREAIRPLKTTG